MGVTVSSLDASSSVGSGPEASSVDDSDVGSFTPGEPLNDESSEDEVAVEEVSTTS